MSLNARPGREKWQVKAELRSIQANAYIINAIRQMRMRAADHHLKRWFGDTDRFIRAEVNRVLNSVAGMISNVEYVYPGDDCGEDTFAYVYPDDDDDDDGDTFTPEGKFVFYLCPLWLKSTPGVQIETLVHEGSHHATAYTDDVCLDKPAQYIEKPIAAFSFTEGIGGLLHNEYEFTLNGTLRTVQPRLVKDNIVVCEVLDTAVDDSDTEVDDSDTNPTSDEDCEDVAYSRRTCSKLAREDPLRATRNADNFCLFVSDVTDKSRRRVL